MVNAGHFRIAKEIIQDVHQCRLRQNTPSGKSSPISSIRHGE
jgi:hypothetical protein